MRKLLQELYEYDSLRKQASTPGAPSPSSLAPGTPAATSATTPASTGTQASTQPPHGNFNAGLVREVPATRVRHLAPRQWTPDSKLQYIMTEDGRGFIRMINPSPDRPSTVEKTWLPGDEGFADMMQRYILPAQGSSNFEGPAMRTNLGILRIVGKPTGLIQQQWKDGHWVDFRTASPDDKFKTWSAPATTTPTTDTATSTADTATSTADTATSTTDTTTPTQPTDEDIQEFNRAYAEHGGVIPEQLDGTKAPAEKWYNDPRVQQKALWGTGIGLATALGGYALTGGRGGVAPWLLGGLGIGGGIGGMLGYKDWNTAKEQYANNAEQWDAYYKALNKYQNEKKIKQVRPTKEPEIEDGIASEKPLTVPADLLRPASNADKYTATGTVGLIPGKEVDLNSIPRPELPAHEIMSPRGRELNYAYEMKYLEAYAHNLNVLKSSGKLSEEQFQDEMKRVDEERYLASVRREGTPVKKQDRELLEAYQSGKYNPDAWFTPGSIENFIYDWTGAGTLMNLTGNAVDGHRFDFSTYYFPPVTKMRARANAPIPAPTEDSLMQIERFVDDPVVSVPSAVGTQFILQRMREGFRTVDCYNMLRDKARETGQWEVYFEIP